MCTQTLSSSMLRSLFFWPLTLISSEDTLLTGKYILRRNLFNLSETDTDIRLHCRWIKPLWIWPERLTCLIGCDEQRMKTDFCVLSSGFDRASRCPRGWRTEGKVTKKQGYPSDRFDDCGKKYLWPKLVGCLSVYHQVKWKTHFIFKGTSVFCIQKAF